MSTGTSRKGGVPVFVCAQRERLGSSEGRSRGAAVVGKGPVKGPQTV